MASSVKLICLTMGTRVITRGGVLPRTACDTSVDTLEPFHWPTTFTVPTWRWFTQVTCVAYVCVDWHSTWRRLLLLRQRGARLDVGIRFRHHIDVGGPGFSAFQYAFYLSALDARRVVKCGMASVTWCDITANHRRAAHSILHFTFCMPQFRILPIIFGFR